MKTSLLRFQKGSSFLLKTLTVWAGFTVFSHSLRAQSITNYTFNPTTGTYSTLGGTTLSLSSGSNDDGYFNNIPIGFDFYYMGNKYTTVSASTNGWLTLGANITNAQTGNDLSGGGSPRPVIAPLWDDIALNNTTDFSYKTTGTEPNRVLTIEYLGVLWDYSASSSVESFQVNLYETSGKIEFLYRSESGSYKGSGFLGISPTGGASIGISATNTGSGNYLSLNGTGASPSASSTTSTNSLSSKPATGTLYQFTPTGASAPSNLTFTNVGISTMKLNWTDNASNETGYVIYRSTNNVNFTYVTQLPANTTSYTQSSLNGNTVYYWKVYALRESLSSPLTGNQRTCFTLTPISMSSLASMYKFNGNANDEAGFNNGTFQGGTPTATSDRFGNTNRAYTFNGSSQYVSTTNSYSNPSNFTLSIWIKTTTTTGGRLIGFGDAQTGNSGNRDRMLYMSNSGQIYFATNPGGVGYVLNSASSYNDGNWHLITVTCSSSSGSVLYVDGASVASNTSAQGGQNYTGYWRINYDQIGWVSSPTSNYFNGTMDDVLIYDRAITAGEVSSIYSASGDGASSNTPVCYGSTITLSASTMSGASYTWSGPLSFSASSQNTSITSAVTGNAGQYVVTATNGSCSSSVPTTVAINYNNIQQIATSGLIGYYKCNGNGYDESNTNQGTLQNSPTATTDRFGIANSALSFDGSSQYISTTNSYSNPGTFTLSIWFKTTTSNGGRLIGFGGNQTGQSGVYDRQIYMNNAGQLYFAVYPAAVRTINTSSSYNDGNWHMVTASLSSTNGIRLYVDGTLAASDPTTTSAQNYTGYWKIGFDNLTGWPTQPSSFYFSGVLDDVLIYTTELTATEVSTLYKSPDGAGNNGPVCVGNSITFSATTLASATYSWTGPNGFSSSSQNPVLPVYTTSNAGTYTLTVTKGGCSTKAYTLVSSNTTTAGLWTGYTDGNWGTASNWCGGSLPASTTDVTIPAVTNLPTISSLTANCKNLTINSSASLTNASTGTLNVYGNWVNNGTFTDNGIYSNPGSIIFKGTTAQSLSGTTTFNNLTLNNASGLSLNNAVTVTGVLTLTSGTLTTNNNLTQNLYTGAIAGSGTGSTSGNITFSKTIWGDKYHYMSTPISGLSANDWNTNVIIKFGLNSNLYWYNETVADTNKQSGWTAVSSLASTLQSLKGYALYFPRWIYNTPFSITGSYNHSASYIDATLTNTPSTIPFFKASSDGWQLMGNPYPSNLDWDAASGWTKIGLDDAIYMWDGRTSRYIAYVAGIGVNGGTRYIGSMQGFFVKVSTSGGSGTLGISNNARTTSTLKDVWRTESENDVLRLTLSTGSFADETVVRFHDQATEKFDNQLDAYKLFNESEAPSLWSSDDVDYAINSIPSSLSNKTIPLDLVAPSAGEYTWNADLSGITGDKQFDLEDRLIGTTQNLNENPVLSIDLSQGSHEGRFFLHYTNRQSNVTGVSNGTNPSEDLITAFQQTVSIQFGQAQTDVSVQVYDASGKSIYNTSYASVASQEVHSFALPSASTGIYIIKVSSDSASHSQQLYLSK